VVEDSGASAECSLSGTGFPACHLLLFHFSETTGWKACPTEWAGSLCHKDICIYINPALRNGRPAFVQRYVIELARFWRSRIEWR
jgi:hypothetical protein